jgi:hypothetical protein
LSQLSVMEFSDCIFFPVGMPLGFQKHSRALNLK